ncbi:hypothetical protein DV735_g1330, partial [Chaetothyriales sp. CBS 134920]
MKPTTLLPLLLAARGVLAEETTTAGNMGPVALMWPQDRAWGAADDNTAPCGSVEGVTDRTNFPLDYSVIALVTQDESWLVQIAVSLSANPTSNDDFQVVTEATRIQEIDMGHTCYPIGVPEGVTTGTNATIQIRYTSDYDDGVNNTFYACSDITYVPMSLITDDVPCFNATIEDDEEETSSSTTTAASSATSTAASGTSSAASSTGSSAASSSTATAQESGKSGLSGGAIAGIVVGVVGGLAIVLGAFFLLWRRGQRYKMSADANHNPRKVDWDESGAESPNLNKQVELQQLPGRQ